MKLHEYQAKDLLREVGASVPPGVAARSVEEAVAAAEQFGGNFWVVKAMVHAGGRGKGRFKEVASTEILERVVRDEKVGKGEGGSGGVALCNTIEKVRKAASDMLGNTLVTKQTGMDGIQVKTIFVTPGAQIQDELYAAVLLDRQRSQLLLMCSNEGGMDIELVAEEKPWAIKKVWFGSAGLQEKDAEAMADKLGFFVRGDESAEDHAAITKIRAGLIKMFQDLSTTYLQYDGSLLEINPLMIDGDLNVVALDAKMTIDSNAEFRHKELFTQEDVSTKDPYEAEAEKFDLNFIKLDGNIGCMVNGAGLAMSTMDIIKSHGGEPANFLDVGGGAKTHQVKAALEIISRDPN
ncbi:MAG: ATP-grasp domain-containing protein, partial [Myxococcota bacterium]|nr:ATP-grasp domain-containing protein [Myxococcota bacterium]